MERAKPTPEQLEALWAHCVWFTDEMDITCVEQIHQTDEVIFAASDFIEGCVDIVGYKEEEED